MFHHHVLISFKPEASEKDREEVFQLLRGLGERTKQFGLITWSVEKNNDTRTRGWIGQRSIDVVEHGVFDSEYHFQTWKNSQAHQEVAARMSEVMDWAIGDVNEV